MACDSGCLDPSLCDDVAHLSQKCCESGGVGVSGARAAGCRRGVVDLGDDVNDVVAIGGSERGNVQGAGHHSLDRFVELGCHGASMATVTDRACSLRWARSHVWLLGRAAALGRSKGIRGFVRVEDGTGWSCAVFGFGT